MSDRNRHWRESIGVLPGQDRRRQRSRTRENESSAAARVKVRGPAHPADVQADGTDPLFPEGDHALAPVETLIDGLPHGSDGFTAQVAEQLWPEAAPEDLRALTQIIDHRHLVRRGPARRALLRAVVLRRRVAELRLGSRAISPDRDVLEARAQQWDRLARAAQEIREELETDADPGSSTEPVIEAGRRLAEATTAPEGEAALMRTVAALVDGDGRGGSRLSALLPEALEVLDAFRRGALPARQSPLVEVGAGILLIDEDLREGDRPTLRRDRKLIESLLARLDRSIEELVPKHARAPDENAWLAAWRRRALDLRVRIDERLTRPEAADDDIPPASASSSGEEDAAVVDRLRQLRREDDEKPGESSGARLVTWLKRLGGR